MKDSDRDARFQKEAADLLDFLGETPQTPSLPLDPSRLPAVEELIDSYLNEPRETFRARALEHVKGNAKGTEPGTH
jgi:hypothetical protein